LSRDISSPFEVGGPDDGEGHAAILLHTNVDGRPVAVGDTGIAAGTTHGTRMRPEGARWCARQ
jgi:hypothetical protein